MSVIPAQGRRTGKSGEPVRDRRAERAAATRQEILAAAWELMRGEGLAALTMRELGRRVGMRAQSLYGYFAAKNDIYDALFAEANRDLLARIRALPPDADPVSRLRRRGRVFIRFSVEDPVRYQLLFQRTIPGFEPSAESYAAAVELLETGRSALRDCGVHDPAGLDAYTALVAGLVAQQNSNEPGGDRWTRLYDDMLDMYLAHFSRRGAHR